MNKRQFKRHNKRLEVRYSDGNHSAGMGFLKDVSEQGFYIKCRKPMPEGTKIDITATLPDGVRGQIKGVVRRKVMGAHDMSSSTSGMGVEVLAYDKVFSHFLRKVVGDFSGPDLSMYASELGKPVEANTDGKAKAEAARPSVLPDRPEEKKEESVIIACANCRAKNRIPKARFASMPKCGKCGMFLIA